MFPGRSASKGLIEKGVNTADPGNFRSISVSSYPWIRPALIAESLLIGKAL